MRYKNPAVANSESYALATFKTDQTQPIFFHADFCKPGKSTYLVEHKNKKNVSSGFFEMLAFGESACDDQETLELPKAPDLYVHQMLT